MQSFHSFTPLLIKAVERRLFITITANGCRHNNGRISINTLFGLVHFSTSGHGAGLSSSSTERSSLPSRSSTAASEFAKRHGPVEKRSLLRGMSINEFGKQRRVDELCRGLGWTLIMVGVTFAALPLYRMFCESTGFGGTTNVAKELEHIEQMKVVPERLIRVQFNADVHSSMQWKFKPVQHEIYVNPGETALAFFTAENPTDRPIVGISTYNLTPFQAAYYFNKIQCFCFDEQILRPGEKVDLPVFFYIDPEYVNDPQLEYMDELMLSYTFFESKTNLVLPSPFDPTNRPTVTMMNSNNNNSGGGDANAKQQENNTRPPQQEQLDSA